MRDHMKRTLLALFAVFLISGCATSTRAPTEPLVRPIRIAAEPVAVPETLRACAREFWHVHIYNDSDEPIYVSWDVPENKRFFELSYAANKPHHYVVVRDLNAGFYSYRLNPFRPPHKVAGDAFYEVAVPRRSRVEWRMRPPHNKTFLVNNTALFRFWAMTAGQPLRDGVVTVPGPCLRISPTVRTSNGDAQPGAPAAADKPRR